MKTSSRIAAALLCALLCSSCSSFSRSEQLDVGIECVSLLGIPLERPALEPERQARLEADLAAAEERLAAAPDDEEAAIWVGRRLGYLGRYRDAVEVYGDALDDHPKSYRLLRHRGHRYITLRRFDDAASDLKRAASLAVGVPDSYEPDGAPNAHGIPRSTTQSNIYYHLGLAEYLRGDFQAAYDAWHSCMFYSRVNDDMYVATLYWQVLACWKLGRTVEARDLLSCVHEDMHILENQDYHRLLMFFKSGTGEFASPRALTSKDFTAKNVSSSTLANGIGTWHLSHGADIQAHQAFQAALSSDVWAAFGFISAEAELARGRSKR